MEPSTTIFLLIAMAVFGIVATIAILRRNRKAEESTGYEYPFATATEGMKLCPACGFSNLVTDNTCASCRKRIPG
jgi:hypothetical protein